MHCFFLIPLRCTAPADPWIHSAFSPPWCLKTPLTPRQKLTWSPDIIISTSLLCTVPSDARKQSRSCCYFRTLFIFNMCQVRRRLPPPLLVRCSHDFASRGSRRDVFARLSISLTKILKFKDNAYGPVLELLPKKKGDQSSGLVMALKLAYDVYIRRTGLFLPDMVQMK